MDVLFEDNRKKEEGHQTSLIDPIMHTSSISNEFSPQEKIAGHQWTETPADSSDGVSC
jgi:hypothetical protein